MIDYRLELNLNKNDICITFNAIYYTSKIIENILILKCWNILNFEINLNYESHSYRITIMGISHNTQHIQKKKKKTNYS